MALGRITVPRLALAFGLLAALCALQSQVIAATGSSLASEINALFELQKAGGMSTAQLSAATDALIASVSQGGHETSGRPPKLAPPPPPPTHRQLQGAGAPLPPPSGTCPDVLGVQQGLDATDARVDALEVYTDVSAAPRGLIGLWSGAADTVPQGWALCDGTNGTPDLRDKFVVGAGSKYELGRSADSGENVGASVDIGCAGGTSVHGAGTSWTDSNNGVSLTRHYCGGTGHYSGSRDENGVFLTDADLNVVASATIGEPVPAHYALAYIMRLDATCCVCWCDDARPTQPVPVVVPYGTAHDVACRTRCAEATACGHAGGHFADAFSSACV